MGLTACAEVGIAYTTELLFLLDIACTHCPA